MALSSRTQERIFVGVIVFFICVGAAILIWYEDAKSRDVVRVATASIMQANLERHFALSAGYPQKLPETTIILAPAGELQYFPLNNDGTACSSEACATYVVPFSLETNSLGILRGSHSLTPQGIR